MQSQHRYSEVNTLLARAEQEIQGVMDSTLHAEFNALRAQVAINDGNPDEAERPRNWRWMSCPSPCITAVLLQPRCTAKCCTVKATSLAP